MSEFIPNPKTPIENWMTPVMKHRSVPYVVPSPWSVL